MHSNRRQHVRSGQLIRIGAYHIIWARQIVGRVGRAGSSRAQVIFKTEILNEHLICSLCMGYFRDAQSVTECLHTCTRPSYDCSIALARLPRGALLFSFGSLQSVHLQVPACQQRQGRSMSHMRRCFGTGSFRKSPVRCPGRALAISGQPCATRKQRRHVVAQNARQLATTYGFVGVGLWHGRLSLGQQVLTTFRQYSVDGRPAVPTAPLIVQP